MTTLLQLNSSIFSFGGQSSQLADEFAATWRDNNSDAQVVVRDLANEPLPHLDANEFPHLSHSPTPGLLNSRSLSMNRMH